MPELPEVETILQSLLPLVRGRSITSVEVRCRALRRPIARTLSDSLVGHTLVGGRRRAKYMLFDLEDGRSWILHLGMSGRFLYVPEVRGRTPVVHDHVVIALDDGAGLVFHDPRRFGLMVVEDASQSVLLHGIGPEPLDRTQFDAAYLADLRRRTTRTIKDVLMDQQVVAGLGNIYVNESLFVAGIRPTRRLSRLSLVECERLVDATRMVLREAIHHRGSSIADFLDGIGRRGEYQWRRRVYDREGEPCRECGTIVKSVTVGQRSSFYCPACQR